MRRKRSKRRWSESRVDEEERDFKEQGGRGNTECGRGVGLIDGLEGEDGEESRWKEVGVRGW